MTNEEAIILIECSATELVGAMAEAKNEREAKQIQRYIDAYDMAISALRQQEHFRDVTKKVEPMTNAQRIRAMSDEELAVVMYKPFCDKRTDKECMEFRDCKKCALAWLQMPAGEEEA